MTISEYEEGHIPPLFMMVTALVSSPCAWSGFGFSLPGHSVLDYTKNVVVWSDSPALLVGRVGDVELSIFLIIGVECKA